MSQKRMNFKDVRTCNVVDCYHVIDGNVLNDHFLRNIEILFYKIYFY